MTTAVAERMRDLMVEVSEAAIDWRSLLEALDASKGIELEPGDREAMELAEFRAHEDLVHTILDFADEYQGFAVMLEAVEGVEPE